MVENCEELLYNANNREDLINLEIKLIHFRVIMCTAGVIVVTVITLVSAVTVVTVETVETIGGCRNVLLKSTMVFFFKK